MKHDYEYFLGRLIESVCFVLVAATFIWLVTSLIQ